ncbi:MAG: hypothetical protein ACTSQY_00075 [Candidatus Odinarchaeia archaeon]|nr:MAG: hypothetical protein [Lokiarchaeota virus Fenrir Meg22_1012]URC17194.1 MAG: hypothetical protein [Lokiarchaeota virus Fenrir Meg22_1214]
MAYKYMTKSDVISWVKLQRVDLTEDDIPDETMELAETKVDAELMIKGFLDPSTGLPTEKDENNFLKMAAMCFCLALLCKNGLITQTSGEILSNRFGNVAYQYQRTNPLFFFATGSSDPFMELMPYETLRMYAYSFIRAYGKYWFFNKYGHKRPKPKLVMDKTSRGAFWNIHYSEHDLDDAEYGELLPEENYY